MPVLLSPIERAVLDRTLDALTLEQLQAQLPEYEPESIKSAIAFLRRRRLIALDGVIWRMTEVGARVYVREVGRCLDAA